MAPASALPSFPVTDEVLDQLEHALGGSLRFVDGEPVIVGADYSLPALLDFHAGRESVQCVLLSSPGIEPEVWDTPPTFSESDVIRALIAEVRRLRSHERAR